MPDRLESALTHGLIPRRHIIHGLVAELAGLNSGSEEYERKLALLGKHIAAGAEPIGEPGGDAAAPARLNRPSWRARWLKHKAQLSHAGRALLRTMRQAVGRTLPNGHARPQRVDHAASAAAGRAAQADPPGIEASPSGRFTQGRFGKDSSHTARSRGLLYMLYEPASRATGPAPLLVLLHGCSQTALDFAAGTRMNEAAERAGVFVLYPEQSLAANPLRCWNWYALQDRSYRDGDATLIAALTRQMIGEHDIDAARVYVAGMSAGGGMAAVLARDYPRLYAALGVHSGAPAGLAHDALSAMRLMSSGPGRSEVDAIVSCPDCDGHPMASIVFHGDEDIVVHPSNGQAIHARGGAQAQAAARDSLPVTTDSGAGQRGFTRTVEYGPGGVTKRELWIVHGGGHKWAGGKEAQRHTDPNVPNASREMLRFLLQHRLDG